MESEVGVDFRQALSGWLVSAGLGELVAAPQPVAGGDTDATFRCELSDTPVFVKMAEAQALSRLQAEAASLSAIAATGTVRVPHVVAVDECDGFAFLVLEWLDLGTLTPSTEAALGQQLARLHRSSGPHFGWAGDNWLGGSPQINTPDSHWANFFATRRLSVHLQAVEQRGDHELADLGAALIERLPEILAEHAPQPSLVHGDLWSGNAAASDQTPVIFDPAAHWADRETDLAMTRLFGGFGEAFYAAYESEWPLTAGSERRMLLYQLYQRLNHLNLFGASYRSGCLSTIQTLLRQ